MAKKRHHHKHGIAVVEQTLSWRTFAHDRLRSTHAHRKIGAAGLAIGNNVARLLRSHWLLCVCVCEKVVQYDADNSAATERKVAQHFTVFFVRGFV